MSHKNKRNLATILSLLTISVSMFMLPTTAFAATCNNIANAVYNGTNVATGSQSTCGNSQGTVTNGIKTVSVEVINILSIVVGIIAVIMIVYGGFRYITSGGESGSVSSAKNTLIFAIIGLILVALAQVIVHWVLNTASTFNTPGAYLVYHIFNHLV